MKLVLCLTFVKLQVDLVAHFLQLGLSLSITWNLLRAKHWLLHLLIVLSLCHDPEELFFLLDDSFLFISYLLLD